MNSSKQIPWRRLTWLTLWLTGSLALVAQSSPPPEPESPPDPAAPAAPMVDVTVAGSSQQNIYVNTGIHSEDGEIVNFGDVFLDVGEEASAVVAIKGSITIKGHATEDAVAILGDATIDGDVDGDVVAILGRVRVNGKVGGDVVAVLGSVDLGPNAVVHGQAVGIGGGVNAEPGAKVSDEIVRLRFLPGSGNVGGLRPWFMDALFMGRLLCTTPGTGWAWGIASAFLLVDLLLALFAPQFIDSCSDTFAAKPGQVIGASFLTLILTPVLMVVLSVTFVGPVLLLLIALVGGFVGKTAILNAIGRPITRRLGFPLPAVAVLVGGLIVMGIYLVPVLAIVWWKAMGFLGLGLMVYVCFTTIQSRRPAVPVPPAATVPPVSPTPEPPVAASAAAMADEPAADQTGPAAAAPGPQAAPASSQPPPLSPMSDAALLAAPRAGFWIRVAAALLDFVLVVMLVNVLNDIVPIIDLEDGMFFWFAGYCVAFWAKKGTTIGGIICGLKVVRLDGRPLDWTTALVRGLGGFLSIVMAGLGFIWVAFDDERQSWHDKIAGTTIVRAPKGTKFL